MRESKLTLTSDRTQKTVQVFHDLVNHKFRLCPTSHEDILDLGEDVVFCFELGKRLWRRQRLRN